MRLERWLAFGWSFCAAVHAADLPSNFDGLPTCGIKCFNSVTESSSCEDLSSTACICAEGGFHDALHKCAADSCSVVEALNVSRIESTACDRPLRSRKTDLLIPLALEVPAWVCPWLRVYSRWMTDHFALDDYLMLACGMLYTVFLVFGQYTGQSFYAVDTWSIDPSDVVTGLKWFYIGETFYILCLCLSKVSILFFYLRIFPNRNFRYATYATMALVVVPSALITLLQIFQCLPVSYIWEGWADENRKSQCLDASSAAYIAGGVCIVQDLVILVLPLPLLYKLNTDFRTKAGIIFMFSLGIFVLVTSCVRIKYLVGFGTNKNPMWEYSDALIWSGLEVAISIIVACLPAIRVLIIRFVPHFWTSIFSNRGTADGYVREGEPSDASAARSNQQQRSGHRSQRRRSIMFGLGKDEETESQVELSLHLGDKKHGEVQTEVYGGGRSIRKNDDVGIRVMTTMMTAVDANGSPSARDERTSGL